MEVHMKVNSNQMRWVAKEFISGKMENSTKDSGVTI